MRIYHCPECGSTSLWKQFLVKSSPHACPSCDTVLIPSYLHSAGSLVVLSMDGLILLGMAVHEFAAPHPSLWGRASVGVLIALEVAGFVLLKGRWVKDTSNLSPDEICAKLREAEALIRQGASAADAARQIDVPYAVFRRWRKQYGDSSDSSTLKTQ